MLGWIERQLLYFPSTEMVQPVSAFGPNAQEVWFGEHARLHGVFAPASGQRSGPPVTIVFFHGNGGNLSHRAAFVSSMQSELGAHVFIFDYQGYGQSGGIPSEQALAADAQAAIEYVMTRSEIDPARIVYYGESLGGAVAIQLATARPPAGLIVQSSFTSIGAMTRLHHPYLAPLLPYVATRFDSLAAVPLIRAPMLMIHGESDSLVPPDQSRQLQQAAAGPAELVLVPGAGHNDVFVRGGPELWRTVRAFLASLGAAPPR
jgi:uncharacterized protein